MGESYPSGSFFASSFFSNSERFTQFPDATLRVFTGGSWRNLRDDKRGRCVELWAGQQPAWKFRRGCASL